MLRTRSGAAGHVHAPASFGTAFAIGITLNLGFVILEVDLRHLRPLARAHRGRGSQPRRRPGLAAGLGRYFPGPHRTDRAPDLRIKKLVDSRGSFQRDLPADHVGSDCLGSDSPLWRSQPRWKPIPLSGLPPLGSVINTATALMFMSGRKRDLNIRAAFLHMAADAGVSLGVVDRRLSHHRHGAGIGSIRR